MKKKVAFFILTLLILNACVQNDQSLNMDCVENCYPTLFATTKIETDKTILMNLNQNTLPVDFNEMISEYDVEQSQIALQSTETDSSTTDDFDSEMIPDVDEEDSTPDSNEEDMPATLNSGCVSYSKWDYTPGNIISDIQVDFIKNIQPQDCLTTQDADQDGLSASIDPDDHIFTTWFQVIPVRNPDRFMNYSDDHTYHYRFVSNPRAFRAFNSNYADSDADEFENFIGVTDWSKAIESDTNCGFMFETQGICIYYTTMNYKTIEIPLSTPNTNVRY